MYSDFDGTLLRELEHIDSTVTVLSTFNNGGLEVGSPSAAFYTVTHVVEFQELFLWAVLEFVQQLSIF